MVYRIKRRKGTITRAAETARTAKRAYDLILGEILDGRLAPGTRLIEAQLAKRFGISRTPLRETLFLLQQRGLVESEFNCGFSVKPLSEREAREVYPMLAALEREGLREGLPLIKLDLPILQKANTALLRASHDAFAAVEGDRAFHLLLVGRSSNSLLLRTIRNLHKILFRYEILYMSDPSLIRESVRQHASILASIEKGRLDAALNDLSRNYELGMQTVINRLRQVSLLPSSS
jgi:DNA-binding GntR family transcriptional regulator